MFNAIFPSRSLAIQASPPSNLYLQHHLLVWDPVASGLVLNLHSVPSTRPHPPYLFPAHLTHPPTHTHIPKHTEHTYAHTDTQMHLQRCTHRTDRDADTSVCIHTHTRGRLFLSSTPRPPYMHLLPAWPPALASALHSPAPELCSLAGPGTEAEPCFPSPAAKWNQQTGRTAGFERTTSWASEKLICWLICLRSANCSCDSLRPSAPPS